MTIQIRSLVPLVLGGLAVLASPGKALAQSEDGDNKVRGSIVAGVAAVPDYEGAEDLQLIPLINGRIAFGDRYVALEGVTLRANIIASPNIEFGPVANLTFGRDDDIDSAAVAALAPIDDAYEIGAFVAFSRPAGAKGRLRFAVQAVQDVSDVHNGWVATASLGYQVALSSRFDLGLEASASYASDEYAATYFSVTPAGALASGLPVFNADGGFKDVGATLTARYGLSDRWSLVAFGGYRRLLGDFADSPIVEREGDANQLSGGVGVSLAF